MMKVLWSLLLFIVFHNIASAQRLRKYPIGNSGCAVYCFCDANYTAQINEDATTFLSGTCESDGIYYNVICIQIAQPVDMGAAEALLVNNLDELKLKLGITKAAGYGKGHFLNNNEQTRGIMDYWEDGKKNNYKVKAWTNGKYTGLLYAYTQQEIPENKVNIFLDSFRFPE